MMWRICETCAHSAWRDGKTAVTEVCLICTFGKDGQPTNWKEKTMTNADRIRAMSDEELARWITYACDVDLEMFCSNPKRTRPCDNNCDLCAIDWLEQPAEEET